MNVHSKIIHRCTLCLKSLTETIVNIMKVTCSNVYHSWISSTFQRRINSSKNGLIYIWSITALSIEDSRTSSVCSEMTGQWSDRSAMSGCKTLSPPGPMSYLCGLALRIWTSFWRREDSDGMDMWNAPVVQSRRPLTYRLMESVGLGGPKWHGSSWQRGIAESGSSRLSTLMIEASGDLVWDLPCVQQASYLEGGPLMWMLPLYMLVNQKSNYDMIYDMIG